jgi:hypothetical protein
MWIRDGDIWDPGWKKVGSGMNIPDPQHWKFFFSCNFFLQFLVIEALDLDPDRYLS